MIEGHSLLKCIQGLKYEQDWIKGREDMTRTRYLELRNGRQDGRSDRMVTIGRYFSFDFILAGAMERCYLSLVQLSSPPPPSNSFPFFLNMGISCANLW